MCEGEITIGISLIRQLSTQTNTNHKKVTKAYSKPYHTSKIERLAKVVKGF